MKIFSSFGGTSDLPPDIPPEVKDLITKIAKLINDTEDVGIEGFLLGPGLVEGEGIISHDEDVAEVRADHERVNHLANHIMALGDDYMKTDGNKLRYLSMQMYRVSLQHGSCVHDDAVADDLLDMADRLDELDMKESEIGR